MTLSERVEADIRDSEEQDDEMHVWHRGLLSVAYPIGQTYSGDGIVQIAIGARKG